MSALRSDSGRTYRRWWSIAGVFAMCAVAATATSPVLGAPRAFYFKAVWAQSIFTIDPESNLGIGNPTSGIVLVDDGMGGLIAMDQEGDALDGVIIYDIDEAIDTTDPFTSPFCASCDASNQAFYVFPGPVNDPMGPIGQGINGFNFSRIAKLSTPANDDLIFPRGQSSSGGAELDPMQMKVINDAPNFIVPPPPDFLDSASLIDHMITVAGTPQRLEMAFVSDGTAYDSLDPLASIDFDDFTPPTDWGFSLLGSAAVILPGHPFVPGELREIPFGDANLNGIVDAGDYTTWANNFGIGDGYGTGSTDDAIIIDGDFTIDGIVNAADYTTWANNFGQNFNVPVAAAVPEPASLLLAVIGVCGLLMGLGHRRSVPVRTDT